MQPTQTTWTQPPAPEPRPARSWPLLVVLVVLAAAVGSAGTLLVQKLGAHHGGGATTPAPARTFVATGRLTLQDMDTVRANCRGQGGYSDIQTGTQVIVYDASGKQLAVGQLGLGAAADAFDCIYPFVVTGVPVGDGGPYSVEVSHRGKIAFTRAQAAYIQMSLG